MSQVVVQSKPSEGLKHEIKAGEHTLLSDAPKHAGGEASAPDPHELLMAALGACTSMTLQIYAGKKGWNLKHVRVQLDEQEIDDPTNPGKKSTRINRHIEVSGDLTSEQVESLKAIADKCPIHKLLTGHKEIATDIKSATAIAS